MDITTATWVSDDGTQAETAVWPGRTNTAPAIATAAAWLGCDPADVETGPAIGHDGDDPDAWWVVDPDEPEEGIVHIQHHRGI